ncbi:MAG: SPOR domain-containing protein [Candidatus Omnitrophica bacterium]|nr:SPOR domain-containing protein [Candidatus Omnitrophota bacterium]
MKSGIIFLSALIAVFAMAQPALASSAGTLRVNKLFLEGKYAAAISESEAIIASSASSKDEVYYLKGLSELKSGKFDNARASFNSIIYRYPRSKVLFDAYLGIGDSYLLQADYDKALAEYGLIMKKFSRDKNMPIVHSRMARCYAAMGAREEAEYYSGMASRCAPLSFEARMKPVVGAPVRDLRPAAAVSDTGSVRESLSVQVGSFKNKRNADKLARKLANSGYESFVAIPVEAKDKFYRVKVGRFSSRAQALSLVSRLQADGYPARICDND